MATLIDRVKKLEAIRDARAAAAKDIEPMVFATRWMQLIHAGQSRATELFHAARSRLEAANAADHTDLA